MTVDTSALHVARSYFEAWAKGDQDTVRALLAEDVDFISPQDHFVRADDFLADCWRYSDGLNGVVCMKEVTDGDQVFMILDWHMADGARFVSAEYVQVVDGRIQEIIVVNNSPVLGKMFY